MTAKTTPFDPAKHIDLSGFTSSPLKGEEEKDRGAGDEQQALDSGTT
jgi:hypothetical protein